MYSSAGSLQPRCFMLSASMGCAKPALAHGAMLRLPQHGCPQLTSLVSLRGISVQQPALRRAPVATELSAAHPAAAAAAAAAGSGRGACSVLAQPQLGASAQQLRSAHRHSQRRQHSGVRHRRGGLQVRAAAGVLRPTLAGETLTQLAARFMVSIPSHSQHCCAWRQIRKHVLSFNIC